MPAEILLCWNKCVILLHGISEWSGFIFSTNKLFKAVYTSYWTSDHLKSRGIGPMDNFDLPHFFLSNYLLLVSVVWCHAGCHVISHRPVALQQCSSCALCTQRVYVSTKLSFDQRYKGGIINNSQTTGVVCFIYLFIHLYSLASFTHESHLCCERTSPIPLQSSHFMHMILSFCSKLHFKKWSDPM